MSTSQVVVLTGMLASGKTTFVVNYLDHIALSGQALPHVIVNDISVDENVDAAFIRAASGARVDDLRAGCIGCDDRASFLAALRQSIDEGHDVLIEPSGLIPGEEIVDLLTEAKARFIVLCMVRVDSFPGLIAAGGELKRVIDAQLKVADMVCYTATDFSPDTLETVAAYVASMAPHARNGGLVPHDGVPRNVIDWMREGRRPMALHIMKACGCSGHSHDQGCDAQKSHGGLHVTAAPIPEGMTPEGIATLCASIPGLRRMKACLDGCVVQLGMDGAFTVTSSSTTRGMVNFFTDANIPAHVIAQLGTHGDAVRAARWLMDRMPCNVAANGELRVVTDRDWIARKLVEDPSVSSIDRADILTRYIEWRIRSAELLAADPSRWEGHPKLGYWKRWLGTELALRTHLHADILGNDVVRRVAALKPATMAMEGLLLIDEVVSDDPEDTPVNPECINRVVEFGRRYESLSNELVQRALKHVGRYASVGACA